MKQVILAVLVLFLSSSTPVSAYPIIGDEIDKEYPEDRLSARLENDKIILKQRDKIYSFPDSKEFLGIQQVLKVDLDGDGQQEYIIGAQLEFSDGECIFPHSLILICKNKDGNLEIQYKIITGDYFDNVRPYDVTKDGTMDLVIEGMTGQLVDLCIIAWQGGRYVILWNLSSRAGVSFDGINANAEGNAQITVGVPPNEDWLPIDEPNWEKWVWNGKEFVYSYTLKKVIEKSRLEDARREGWIR